MNFDPTKPVQTRDGRKARIICTDAKRDDPIIALVEDDGEDLPYFYFNDGSYFLGEKEPLDLINVPVEHERTYWLLHFKDGGIGVLPSKPQAVSGFIRAITGPHTIKFTEGEGL